jgi:hypothetical protein
MPTLNSIQNNSSDWLTVKEAMQYAKISRSRIYGLIADREVKTVSIKRRGKTKGKRYLSRMSMDALFNTQCDTQRS